MEFDRRTVLASLAGVTGAAGLPLEAARAQQGDDFAHPFKHDPNTHDEIAMLIYPQMTMLDLVGPQYFLGLMDGAKIHLVTNQPDLSPVRSDTGIVIQPTITMADCPRDLTLIFAPGGTAAVNTARDEATLEFLRDRAMRARYVSSVCTGSLILGAAGLLRGKRATSHWIAVDHLSQFGATPVHERVVEDGNLITAAGVSAGLDLGVTLLARLRGRPMAEAATLFAQYAPEPPFPGGTLDTARPQIRVALMNELRSVTEQIASLRLAPAVGHL